LDTILNTLISSYSEDQEYKHKDKAVKDNNVLSRLAQKCMTVNRTYILLICNGVRIPLLHKTIGIQTKSYSTTYSITTTLIGIKLRN